MNEYIGLPHKPQGRTKQGVDCWGLVCVVYADLGIALPQYSGWYEETESVGPLNAVAEVEKHRWKRVEEPQKYDVVLFNIPTPNGRFPAHVGVVIDEKRMIHSERGRDVAVEEYRGNRWRHRIEGFYRYV